jgi:hypothetical protein
MIASVTKGRNLRVIWLLLLLDRHHFKNLFMHITRFKIGPLTTNLKKIWLTICGNMWEITPQSTLCDSMPCQFVSLQTIKFIYCKLFMFI